MRAVAIVAVLISHLAPNCHAFGIAGVEWFFVLSGYLVGGIFCRQYLHGDKFGRKELFNFWNRRWWRTLPNYYLFVIVFIFFGIWKLGWPIPVKDVLLSLVFLQNLGWPPSSYFNISWSLAVEEIFYLTFPLAVILWGLVVGRSRKAIFLGALSIILISTIWRFSSSPENWDGGMRKIVLGRLDAIQFGVLGALAHEWLPNVWKRLSPVALLGFAITIFCFWATHVQYPFGRDIVSPEILFFLWPLGGLLLLPMIVRLGRPGGVFELFSVGVTTISKISYSIYLCHLPLKHVIKAGFLEAFGDGTLVWVISKIVTLAAIFGVSWLLFTYFESPMMRFRQPEKRTRRSLAK